MNGNNTSGTVFVYLHGQTVHQQYQMLYCPTNALNYINYRLLKTQEKYKICSNMFRFTQEHHQGAKVSAQLKLQVWFHCAWRYERCQCYGGNCRHNAVVVKSGELIGTKEWRYIRGVALTDFVITGFDCPCQYISYLQIHLNTKIRLATKIVSVLVIVTKLTTEMKQGGGSGRFRGSPIGWQGQKVYKMFGKKCF